MKKPPQVVRSIDGISPRAPVRRTRLEIMKRSFRRNRRFQIISVIIVICLLTLVGLRIYSLEKKPNYNDVSTVTRKLSKHVVLPNESPILATVTDKTALKTPFLQEAENGDRVLIYQKARKVILYRPSIDRIVNIGPVELNNIPKQ